jgi:hypothetical protein
MSHQRVRCPHCSRRFDVTGIAAGTSLRCGGCRAILKVPRFHAPAAFMRLPLLRIAAAAIVALVTVAVLSMALRPVPGTSGPETPRDPAVGRALAPVIDSGTDSGMIEDPISRLTQEILREFPGRQFSFSARTRPYFIAVEASEQFVGRGWADDYAKELETAFTAFRREVAERTGLPPVKDTLLPVLIFGSRAGFDRYCEMRDGRRQTPGVKGFYEYPGKRIVTYQDAAFPQEPLLHEAAHQLFDHYQSRGTEGRRISASFWMQEGIACYFEAFRRRPDGEIALGRGDDSRRLPLLKHLLRSPERPEFVPLSRLVGTTVDGFWEWVERDRIDEPTEVLRRMQVHYAESWALVHFLRESGPRHRKVFNDAFRREIAGAGSKGQFEDLVRRELGLDLFQLEEEFVKYIRELK